MAFHVHALVDVRVLAVGVGADLSIDAEPLQAIAILLQQAGREAEKVRGGWPQWRHDTELRWDGVRQGAAGAGSGCRWGGFGRLGSGPVSSLFLYIPPSPLQLERACEKPPVIVRVAPVSTGRFRAKTLIYLFGIVLV